MILNKRQNTNGFRFICSSVKSQFRFSEKNVGKDKNSTWAFQIFPEFQLLWISSFCQKIGINHQLVPVVYEIIKSLPVVQKKEENNMVGLIDEKVCLIDEKVWLMKKQREDSTLCDNCYMLDLLEADWSQLNFILSKSGFSCFRQKFCLVALNRQANQGKR